MIDRRDSRFGPRLRLAPNQTDAPLVRDNLLHRDEQQRRLTLITTNGSADQTIRGFVETAGGTRGKERGGRQRTWACTRRVRAGRVTSLSRMRLVWRNPPRERRGRREEEGFARMPRNAIVSRLVFYSAYGAGRKSVSVRGNRDPWINAIVRDRPRSSRIHSSLP